MPRCEARFERSGLLQRPLFRQRRQLKLKKILPRSLDDHKHPRPRRAAQQGNCHARNDDAESSSAEGVIAALDALVDGIQRSDVEAVMKLYWSSPQLTIFNNNGTVTRTWDQLHSNRASAYPNAKDVKLDIRNRNVQMIGRDGAVVTCQRAQTQFYRSNPESASGRLTLVFRRIGPAWKIVHTHTSPDAPEPSRLMSSEREAAEDSHTAAEAPAVNGVGNCKKLR
ncbi:MAG: AtzH-like domain-containing protein [Pyrinomonadaceae bacterium]